MSLRTKVSLMILIPSIVIITISSLIHYHSEREEALATMSLLASQTGDVIERAIQHDMLESDFEHIQRVFDDIGEDPRIGSLLLLDLNGQVFFSPNKEQFNLILNNQEGSCLPCHNLTPQERPSGIVTTTQGGQRFFRSMHPIDNLPECHQCHDPDQKIIGVLLTDLSIEPIEHSLAAGLRGNLIWWGVTALLILLLVNFAVRRWIITRIESLHMALDDFGRLPKPQELPEGPQDEIGRLRHTFNVMAERISKRDTENQKLSQALNKRDAERGNLLRRIITAQEDERLRVARELHDELGQSLSSTALQIEMAKRKLSSEEKDGPIANLEQANLILKDATDQMYDLISGLRPSVLDDHGLEAAFRSLANRILEPVGIEFTLDCRTLDHRFPPEIEIVIYRVFQEAFTNVLRHAQASAVSLCISTEKHHVVGEMIDNGIGFDPEGIARDERKSNGLGLVGMRERVEQIEGSLSFISKPGEGTRILLRIPLDGSTHD